MKRVRHSSHFTLIELLVVVAIIAVLASLLLPSLSRTRTEAKKTEALSNLRQLNMAFFDYAGDYDDGLPWSRYQFDPPYVHFRAVNISEHYWGGLMCHWGYVSDISIYWSPNHDTSEIDLEAATANPISNVSAFRFTGFGVNINGAMPNGKSYPGKVPIKLSASPDPSNHILMADTATGSHRVHTDGADLRGYNLKVPRSYIDGHAAAIDGIDLKWQAFSDTTGTWRFNSSHHPKAPWYSYLTGGGP